MSSERQQLSDEELAQQAQAGCLLSFEELVRRYEARIYRFVANTSHNNADARELTQDTFVAAYRGLASFDINRSFVTWLFTIARRKCIDRHRAWQPVVEERVPDIADVNDASVLLAQREAEETLWNLARRSLPGLQFQALWLKYAEDLSVAAIARVLRRTQPHVKVLLYRGRLALARLLKREKEKERAGGARQPFAQRVPLLEPAPNRVV